MKTAAPARILLVDDDPGVVQALSCYLENHGFSVTSTKDSSRALSLAKESRPDLVVTDAEMPGLDGLALCKALKELPQSPAIPVIIISGLKTGEEDIVSGYGEGADDYLLKPFSFPVLAAKIKAVLRRYSACTSREHPSVRELGMEIDPGARTVLVEGRKAPLTRKEFDLLTLLLEKENRVLSIPFILESVWGYDPASYNDPHTVQVHIYSLKKKLGPSAAAHIESVMGHGYKFSL